MKTRRDGDGRNARLSTGNKFWEELSWCSRLSLSFSLCVGGRLLVRVADLSQIPGGTSCVCVCVSLLFIVHASSPNSQKLSDQ